MHTPVAFDWDDENEARHVEKHGVPFGIAAGVFEDPKRMERDDLRPNKYGERRWNVVGKVDGIHLNATFAIAGDMTHIISARSAQRKERKAYDGQ